jgi:hypothetical protein
MAKKPGAPTLVGIVNQDPETKKQENILLQ